MNRISPITPGSPFPDVPTAGAVSSTSPAVPATFPCPECEGTGFFSTGDFHPDDPRSAATWDCDECGGSGEVDYEPIANYGAPMSLADARAQIARVFNPTGWALAEQAALNSEAAAVGGR